MKRALITGSCGLIGSEAVRHFLSLGWLVYGIDNGGRAEFFGKDGSVDQAYSALTMLKGYVHCEVDVSVRCDVEQILRWIDRGTPDLVIHAAGQPSHDTAAKVPYRDFEVNALGTFNMLEACRKHAPEAAFVFLSTNKVYGDTPNYTWPHDEKMSVDQSMHSLFGCSKLAADVYVQEYGRYFGMKTCSLRCGCLSGGAHAGVEQHGFLSYLVKCNVERIPYVIHGFGGEQVRDNLHASDVAKFSEQFYLAPRRGEVYNLGGGVQNACSILEAISRIQELSGIDMVYSFSDKPRLGDHYKYISDLTKVRSHYPGWDVTVTLDQIFKELYEAASSRAPRVAR